MSVAVGAENKANMNNKDNFFNGSEQLLSCQYEIHVDFKISASTYTGLRVIHHNEGN